MDDACASVLRACRGDWLAALAFFERALQWEPRVVLAVSSYEAVVHACLAAARWREAVEVLRVQNRNGVRLDAQHLRSGMWAAALATDADVPWATCLRFYGRIAPPLRTSTDTSVVANIAPATRSPDAAAAIRNALIAIHRTSSPHSSSAPRRQSYNRY